MFPHALLKRIALVLCLIGGISGESGRALAADDVVEESAPLAVTIDGRSEQLEALIVHPTRGGRFPIALIVNGHSDDPKRLHPSGLAHLAHDFAHRGWLAAVVDWRGYGSSSGLFQDDAGTCTAPAVRRYFGERADDLAAALTALRSRSDADPTTAVGLGISIGGASMLDVAAMSDRPLTAVINISGGLYHHSKPFMPDPTCGPFEADLIRTIGSFGGAHVPTLWIYAENDEWFRPDLVTRMAEAYRQDGGSVDLEMLPPFKDRGHQLYLWEANAFTQPLIDRFLRTNHLPAMAGDEAIQALGTEAGADRRNDIAYYLRMPTEKALAIPDEGSGTYFSFARRSIEEARRDAMAGCLAAKEGACHIVAENSKVLAVPQRSSSGSEKR